MSMRKITFLLCMLLAALFTRASSAQNYCDPNYSFLPAGSPPLTLYQVADPSHIVVMEYMPWIGPNAYHIDATMDVPALASLPGFDGYTYDTADCRVQGQHVAWMMSIGVDAILLDMSNVGQCLFTQRGEPDLVGCGAHDLVQAQTVLDNVRAIFAYYRQHNVPIRIIPMIDAQDGSIWTPYQDGTTGFQRALQFFRAYAAPSAYQNDMVWYRNRPLLAMYTGTPYAHDNVNWLNAASNEINILGMQNAFTYRFVTGFTDSQSPLWDTNTGIPTVAGLHRLAVAGTGRPAGSPFIPYPVWSWIDRLSADLITLVPSYSVETTGGKPENFAVTQAFSGTYCTGPTAPACADYWDAVDTRTRGDTTSSVLDDFMNKAKVLQPRFLMLHQLNEFGHGDQGYSPTRYRMTDVEPTSSINGAPGWGTAYIDLFTAKVADYKNALTRPIDMSTRAWIGTGNNVAIAGFTIAGPGPKKVLIRGFGPSLAAYFGGAALANPRLDLSTPSGWISNDNWQQAANWADIQALGQQPSNPLESAILVTLNPGSYTAIMQGADGGSGIGLIDVYEVDNPGSPLSGMSGRAWVGVNNNQLISGFVIGGTQPQKVLVRVAGPTLAQYGLAALSDPTLTLVSSATGAVIASNNNWQDASNWPDIQAAGAPGDPREPAILITLNPGAYTAIVSGVGGAQGIALPSVYTQ